MSAPTNHWKLGLFVVIGVLMGLAAVVYFGARTIPQQTVTYTSYFDEAVTGLEIGSPVKFRGVTIGNVSRIDVAPDRRHVQVSYELTVAVLGQLGISRGSGEKTRLPMTPNLRAQLNSTGITGIKYVQLDFFDDANSVPPALPFAVSDHYIPSQPSSLKNIEASVVQTADRLPEVMDHLVTVLNHVEHISAQIDQEGLPEHASQLLNHAERTLGSLDEKLAQLDTRALGQQTQATLSSWQGTATRTNQLLDRMGGERGLMASAQRVSDSLGDAAQNANGFLNNELVHTLRDVSEAAGAIKDLADTLERQPDMLLKGRSRAER
jgi:phospholipid/cholesterol/gamma-HCH transport system substrate-binding protein